MGIQFQSIGVIRSPFSSIAEMPIQASKADGAIGSIELLPDYQAGLKDMEGFSHIILIYCFHLSCGFDLAVTPFLDTQPRGLFATRVPKRPNQIGLSIVRLERVEGNILHVKDIDVVSGTPLLDIKPFVEDFDNRFNTRSGWYEIAKNKKVLSDDRFK